jgi:methylenetetrahydrofolate dehydrogenase (NADP+)/methenyltetrahydrofolate cyclohydrolase
MSLSELNEHKEEIMEQSRHTGLLLDTRDLAARKLAALAERVAQLPTTPKLVIIRVGNDFASGKYVNNKIKRCAEVGLLSEIIHLPDDVAEETVAQTIQKLNADETATAVLLQLPIPKHLNEDYLTNLIDARKDVDGFTIANAGKLASGLSCNVPCTPRGIITLLKDANIAIAGQDVLIINRSNIVGKPLAQLFLRENATVTIAHSKTQNLKEKIRNANIVVTAVGKRDFLCADDFSANTTIIDVSINFTAEGKMCGDVTKADYDALRTKGCNITPVPNGVGQMTVVELIDQTIEIAENA